MRVFFLFSATCFSVLGYKSLLFPEDPAVTHMFCLFSALGFLQIDGSSTSLTERPLGRLYVPAL